MMAEYRLSLEGGRMLSVRACHMRNSTLFVGWMLLAAVATAGFAVMGDTGLEPATSQV
jgi:hypothetical protein